MLVPGFAYIYEKSNFKKANLIIASMKKIIFLLMILSLSGSCSTTTSTDTSNLIFGEWVWVESSGGLAGITETPESTEKEIIIQISNNSIKQFINGNLESENSYKIVKRESALFGDVREIMVYDNGFRQIVSISGNHLNLTGDCHDCFQSEYVRK